MRGGRGPRPAPVDSALPPFVPGVKSEASGLRAERTLARVPRGLGAVTCEPVSTSASLPPLGRRRA